MDNQGQETSTRETTRTIPSHYDGSAQSNTDKAAQFNDCIAVLAKKGKQQFGEHFRIDPADYEIIFKLIVYMIKDKANAEKYNINLDKGILLAGPVGCGKTTLLTLLNHFQPQEHRYAMKPCRDVSFEFITDGYKVIHRYSKDSFTRQGERSHPINYCFDDLGTENNLKYYGNECNVMGEILLSRYELFIQKKMITHITTNLSASEIEAMYGSRVRSRMREMFNLIAFGVKVFDKRT